MGRQLCRTPKHQVLHAVLLLHLRDLPGGGLHVFERSALVFHGSFTAALLVLSCESLGERFKTSQDAGVARRHVHIIWLGIRHFFIEYDGQPTLPDKGGLKHD
jgi:hypothetical protein